MPQICVIYRENRAGRKALSFAQDVVRLFGNASLHVYVAHNQSCAGVLERIGTEADTLQTVRIEQRLLEQDIQCGLHRYPEGETPKFPAGSIVVDSGVGNRRSDFHVLNPVQESTLEQRGGGPLLVPFSDGESGLVAARTALELAKQWRGVRTLRDDAPEVIFYHTTWEDKTAISSDALDQMCDSAIAVMVALQAEAERQGVRCKTIVETHDDVVQGVIEMAHQTGACMVVMARGAQIRQGSYVERTLNHSPVPVFVTASDTPQVCPAAEVEKVRQYQHERKAIVGAQSKEVDRRLIARISELPVLRDPLFVMGVVAFMYVLKAVFKITAGLYINSPTVAGDGFHNLADLVQAITVAIVVIIAKRPANERYPYGRKNVEWFASLIIGVMLFAAAGKFILDCVVGLISYVPVVDNAVRALIPVLPHAESSHLDAATFPWVVAITGFSFLLSLVVSRYQIIVGKRTGHASLVADGQETASDGWIEAVTTAGIIAQFFSGWRIIEYPLGLLVAWMILHTARELFVSGWRVLLQHSLEPEHVEQIKTRVAGVAGVSAIGDMKTFQVGHMAVVMVTVESLCGAEGSAYVKKAVEESVRRYILQPDSDFKSADVHVKMERPKPNRHRIGYAMRINAAIACVAPTLDVATHIAVCDVEHGAIVRTKVVPLDEDALGIALEKRIQKLFVLAPQPAEVASFGKRPNRLVAKPGSASEELRPELLESICYTLDPIGLAV